MSSQPFMQSCPLLAGLKEPVEVQALSPEELLQLGAELRQTIIQTVSKTGGHLAPSLGVVELTLALLRVFNPEEDRIIWDVGHQAYAYKLLTGRFVNFASLRQQGGVSGFPRPEESPYDHFGVGHSSTSISAGLGMAAARDLLGTRRKIVSIIGDGSMTAGLAYEGLNQAGGLGKNMLVILNDNEMSIARNVGALSSFLSRKLSKRWVQRFKREVEGIMRQIPRIGDDIAEYARRSEDSLKTFFTPGMLFEAFRFTYIGPFQGHDLDTLTSVLQQTRELEGPVLLHVLTKKGKGYEPAEINPSYFHGVGCFEPETGESKKFGACSLPTYTDVFGATLCELAQKDSAVVAITAAMPEGTGLGPFAEKYPERFFDVGICEQHAVTFAAGLASQGMRPVVAIYSTFMQRAYDQIIHDVCLQNLHVIFCLDRSGLVGEDGATHHGAFDFSYLRHIPNMLLMAPRNEPELQRMLVTALAYKGPVALRYPRGIGEGASVLENPTAIPIGQGEVLRQGQDGVIIAIGSRVNPALEAAKRFEETTGARVAVLDARFVKPLPAQQILELIRGAPFLVTVEENVLPGGFGSAILELLAAEDALGKIRIRRLALPDAFVEHGRQNDLRSLVGLDSTGILDTLMQFVEEKNA